MKSGGSSSDHYFQFREEELGECEREPSNQELANPPEQQPDSLPVVTPDHDQQLTDQGETARGEE